MVIKLQLALDLVHLDRAIEIAKKASKSVDFLEAGTPLIKSEGIRCVETLKKIFPDKRIVADMKTMDTGYLEVEMAARAGADIISVLGAASNSTIAGALEARDDYGVEVMVDLMGIKNKLERAKEMERMGVDYLIVHTGIDDQMTGKSPFEEFRKISREISVKLAVAGGIKPERVQILKGSRVDVVIVGGYITKSSDPTEAAAQMRKALFQLEDNPSYSRWI